MTIEIKVRESGQTGRENDLDENNKYEKETSLAEKGRACELQGREVDGCRGHCRDNLGNDFMDRYGRRWIGIGKGVQWIGKGAAWISVDTRVD